MHLLSICPANAPFTPFYKNFPICGKKIFRRVGYSAKWFEKLAKIQRVLAPKANNTQNDGVQQTTVVLPWQPDASSIITKCCLYSDYASDCAKFRNDLQSAVHCCQKMAVAQ